jgi:hypothetical protein
VLAFPLLSPAPCTTIKRRLGLDEAGGSQANPARRSVWVAAMWKCWALLALGAGKEALAAVGMRPLLKPSSSPRMWVKAC